MNYIILFGYIIMSIITYFIMRSTFRKDDEWTVGNRLFCVLLGLAWWYTLCIYILMIVNYSEFFERPYFKRKLKP